MAVQIDSEYDKFSKIGDSNRVTAILFHLCVFHCVKVIIAVQSVKAEGAGMYIWINKHRWLFVGLCACMLLVCGLFYLCMIYPRYSIDNMDNVEINTPLDAYIHCENCDDISIQLLDDSGAGINTPQVNITYTCKIGFKSDWLTLNANVPVRFIDTIATEVELTLEQIELEWGESFDATQYI